MEARLDFSRMKFYDFNTVKRSNLKNDHVIMADDCYMCQECYYR